MRRRSSTGGEPVKARRRKAATLKRRNAPKAKRPGSFAGTDQTELARVIRERDAALEQQTAISDVLRVISNSPGDVRPVLDSVAQHAARICQAHIVDIAIVDNKVFRIAASFGEMGRLSSGESVLLDRSTVTGRAICDLQPVQVADLQKAGDEFPLGRELAITHGHRTTLSVPLIRQGRALGAILVRRTEVRPFEEKHIVLLKAFADQAAIAIENVRLFEAEQQRTRELAESLEQQTATAEILQVINSAPGDLAPVFDAMLEKALQLCEAAFGVLWTYDGARVHAAALRGVPPAFAEFLRRAPHPVGPDNAHGRLLRGEFVVHIADVTEDQAYRSGDPIRRTLVELGGGRTLLAIPLRKDGTFLGDFVIYRQEVRPFSEKQIELLQSFAAQAVIAIENTRLLNELRQRTDDLSEALEQQTATADVLRVISSSPTDVQPVLDAIVRTAGELCASEYSIMFRLRDGKYHMACANNAEAEWVKYWSEHPISVDRASVVGRTALERRAVHIPDCLTDPEYTMHEAARLGKQRSMLGVPLLRDGVPIGVIALLRSSMKPFTEKQIELVTTFADQAVIAIENVRLLNELRESLQEQTATSEVLQTISSSPGDLEPVFATMLEKAVRICDANFGNIYRWDGEVLHVVAMHNTPPAFAELRRRTPYRPNSGHIGRMVTTKSVVHIVDAAVGGAYTEGLSATVAAVELGGVRTALLVPMLKENELIGAITLFRQEVRPFAEKQVALVTSFAAQAVIAIENARLLNELRQRTDDLTESLEQQTATSKVLEVISRSAFDLHAVFETVAESSVRLCGADRAFIFRFDGELLRMAVAYNSPLEFTAWVEQHPIRPGRHSGSARAALERRTIHIPDVQADSEYTYGAKDAEAIRTVLGVPILKGDNLLGVMMIYHLEGVRPFTEKQIALVETFADQAAIAIENARLFEAEQQRTRELARSLEDLRTAQDRLVQTQKLASLGQLTAGIAHEIKNPLNFVNNFSGVSVELIDELQETLGRVNADKKTREEIAELADTLRDNLDKIVQHGKRADSIVKNMLLHSREGSGERRPVDVNALVEESLNLAYHGARAEKQGFNVTLERSFDSTAGEVDVFPQEITRVLLNLISNGFYAATKRQGQQSGNGFEPTITAVTKSLGDRVEIRIRDNGIGIPPEVREKMFNPFFTTKPAGEGTGLGLSISHDIVVKQHSGLIEVETEPGQFTEFRIILPRTAA